MSRKQHPLRRSGGQMREDCGNGAIASMSVRDLCRATREASWTALDFFIFFGRNILKSPNSEKFMKINESNFAFISLLFLSSISP
jgi:hypothetical protein